MNVRFPAGIGSIPVCSSRNIHVCRRRRTPSNLEKGHSDHLTGKGRVHPDAPQLSKEAQAVLDELQAQYDALDVDEDSEDGMEEMDRLEQAIAAANKAKKILGLYCANAERALFAAKRGFRFMAVGSDLGFLRAGTAAQVKALKG